MKCKNAKLIISAAIDGEIAERETTALNAHLAGCVECRSERASLNTLRRTLTVWEAQEPAESLADAFAARLRRERETRARGWRALIFPRVQAFGFASVAAAVIIVALFIGTAHYKPQAPIVKDNKTNIVKNDAGQHEQADSQIAVVPAPVREAASEQAVQPVVNQNKPFKPERTRIATRVAKAIIYKSPRRRSTKAIVALAPEATEAAEKLAKSAKLEAEKKITEKALRLKTLLAEANYSIDRAIISPASEVSDEFMEPDAYGSEAEITSI
ncbi:MAG: zf-HC2 domain-containing protein [Armatimonadota bacterium]|nr:zf-HC2 domain-containing protein [Armatimonadota bacterium]